MQKYIYIKNVARCFFNSDAVYLLLNLKSWRSNHTLPAVHHTQAAARTLLTGSLPRSLDMSAIHFDSSLLSQVIGEPGTSETGKKVIDRLKPE